MALVDRLLDGSSADAASAPTGRPGHHAERRPGDGLLPVQQRRRRRPARPRRARPGAGDDPRLGRPSRQRDQRHLPCRPPGAVRLHPPVAAVSGHRPGVPTRARARAGVTPSTCRWRPGSGDPSYRSLVDDVAVPLARAFAPQLVLISAGFDAHAEDPLADCEVTDDGFAAMTRSMREVCAELGAAGGGAGGRVRARRPGPVGGGDPRRLWALAPRAAGGRGVAAGAGARRLGLARERLARRWPVAGRSGAGGASGPAARGAGSGTISMNIRCTPSPRALSRAAPARRRAPGGHRVSGELAPPARGRGPADRPRQVGGESGRPRSRRQTGRTASRARPPAPRGRSRPGWPARAHRRPAPRASASPNPSRSEGTSTALAALTHSGTASGVDVAQAEQRDLAGDLRGAPVEALLGPRGVGGEQQAGRSGSSPSSARASRAVDRSEAVQIDAARAAPATRPPDGPARNLARQRLGDHGDQVHQPQAGQRHRPRARDGRDRCRAA